MQQEDWLGLLIDETVRKRWCLKSDCTTCGAFKFRSAVARRCIRLSGFRPIERHCFDNEPLLSGVPINNRGHCFAVLVNGLRQLPEIGFSLSNEESRSQVNATHLLLIELEYGGRPEYSGKSLDDILHGSWAGSELARMRDHYAREQAWRREQEQYEAAASQRHQEAKRRRAVKHERRKKKKRERDEFRSNTITKLRAMSPIERLRAIAFETFSLPLEALPPDLAQLDPPLLGGLSWEIRKLLIKRIGSRRGAWGKLLKILGKT